MGSKRSEGPGQGGARVFGYHYLSCCIINTYSVGLAGVRRPDHFRLRSILKKKKFDWLGKVGPFLQHIVSREREREIERKRGERERERERESVCVCVRERERERESLES